MSPTRCYLLRRLNTVRFALQRADPAVANVEEIARGHEFLELGRLAAAYRAAFGETPLVTLRNPRIKTSVIRLFCRNRIACVKLLVSNRQVDDEATATAIAVG
jgi:hypothetical protein